MCLKPLGLASPMFFFPDWFGPISLPLHPPTPHLSLLCCKQCSAVFEPAAPNAEIIPKPSVLYFLFLTLTIPSGACCAQYSVIFVPATPKDEILPQSSVVHFLIDVDHPVACCCCCCCFSHSAHWLPTRKKLLYTVANPARGLLNREKKKCAVCSTPPFSYLPLRRTARCDTLRFCTF